MYIFLEVVPKSPGYKFTIRLNDYEWVLKTHLMRKWKFWFFKNRHIIHLTEDCT